MAAETSRSGTSVESYMGSLISLTSKSEIRYEGVLYNINTEESSIGLRNVRSFGTEGRKNGPQVPSSDKIYEYILFRGSDIKDLQVKSSSAIQPASIQNDPAIIQTHYVQPPSTSSSLPSLGSGNVADLTSHTAQSGLPRSTFQGGMPLYQPGSGLGSWGSSTNPPTVNGSGLSMTPMYWQGYYNPSSGLPNLQQPSLLHPPPGMPFPPLVQQPLQYSGISPSNPSGSQNLPDLPPLFPPFTSTASISSSPLPTTLAVSLSSTLAHEASSLLPNKTSVAIAPSLTLGLSLPLVPPLASNIEPIISLPPSTSSVFSSKINTVSVPTMAYQTVSQSANSIIGSSISTQAEASVTLVTPFELLQTASSSLPPSQTSQTIQKDADKVIESKTKPLLPDPSVRPAAADSNEPILLLPKHAANKPNGMHSHAHYYNRGHGRGRGRGRGRGWFSYPVTKFTEDFDFMAMNEKFNKDEVWGHLGKSKAHIKDEDGELGEYIAYDNLEDEEDAVKLDINPFYVKDDFFDSLSCTNLDRGNRGERTKFSEQLKIDTETFGDFPRHRPSRGGGHGFRGGGHGQGSYFGRGYGYGYGYGGRGRDQHYPSNRAN